MSVKLLDVKYILVAVLNVESKLVLRIELHSKLDVELDVELNVELDVELDVELNVESKPVLHVESLSEPKGAPFPYYETASSSGASI